MISAIRRGADTGGWRTAFEHVSEQLGVLAGTFDVGDRAELIGAVHTAICRRSLTFPLGGRPAAPSRLNADGSPVQFATVVGAGTRTLRFVGDPGPLDGDGRGRMHEAYGVMGYVAELIGAAGELGHVRPLLEEFAPADARPLRADPAGAFWVGAAFSPSSAPRMRVYVNGSWGGAATRIARIDRFAAQFGCSQVWHELGPRLPTALAPLGFAVTLGPSVPLRGSVYLRAFGVRLAEYEALARTASGEADADKLRAFGRAILRNDAARPTSSAVLSFTFGSGSLLATELEYCAHCLFADDFEAQDVLEDMFAAAALDPSPYRALITALGPRAARPGPPRFHAFVGASAKATAAAYTVYVNPDLSGSR